jgi:hypothetical protein
MAELKRWCPELRVLKVHAAGGDRKVSFKK